MPILNDIMDHELFGPKIRHGMEMGRQEGREEGEREMVLRQAEKRFGALPGWAKQRLDAMSAIELEATGLRLLDVQSLEQLLS